MAEEQDLEETLTLRGDESANHAALGSYVEVTTRALSMLNLRDCKAQLEQWRQEPLRLAQAAKSAHLALQAALTDALAGTAGIGAFIPTLRAAYLAYFEKSRERTADAPEGDHVMRFDDLLAEAMSRPMEWSGRKLDVSPDELKALERLTFIRHRVEHPRPHHHFIEPRFIAQTLPVAARLTFELMDVCSHHYEAGEREKLAITVSTITDLCATID